jgi:hypothetical protein
MKKLIAFIVVLLLAAGLGLGIRHLWRASRATGKLPELRAVMKDEDEPRPIEPALALQVNEGKDATVFAGTPVWFELNAANEAAMNDVAGTRILATKIARMQSDAAQGHAHPEALQRSMTDYQKRTAPSTIALGDDSHPWTDAVQFVVRNDKGGEKPLSLTLKPLGDQSATVKLDTLYTAQANFGNASADIELGTYSIAACLDATGSWHGRTCSNAVKLTVQPRPGKLTPDQQLALDREKARYGLLAGDYDAIEVYGRELVKANPKSVPGHIYLGDAALGKGKNDAALQEYLTASAQYGKQYPNAQEQPIYLITRINQLLEKMLGTK